ncbi:MAG: hypothetical protein JSW23_05510 [Planctomycetota bacterium]|nr:MAG: hypothetical protein JSW23_05510 [Planctomycetota bacterium]
MKTGNLNSSCRDAELYYYEMLSGEGAGSVPAGVEDHIRRCSRCQEELGRLEGVLSEDGSRLKPGGVGASTNIVGLLKLHLAYIGKRVSCETVRPFLASLCIPELEIRIPTPITAHLQRCRRCSEDLERIRGLNLDVEGLRHLCEVFAGVRSGEKISEGDELEDVVREIVDREEPEIVTIYHMEEPAKAEGESKGDEVYGGYPIRVEVVEPEVAASWINFGEAVRQRISRVSWRPYVRAAAVIAAVALMATVMLNTPAAKALTIGEIYDAVAKIRNVYIAKYVPGKEEPAQELWVSRTLSIYMTKAAGELVLWDIRDGARKSRATSGGRSETTRLTDDVIADMEGKIGDSLGLVPFYDVSEVPKGAEWVRVSGDELEFAAGTEVYDLRWAAEPADERIVLKKWRFFVDGGTRIPERIEVYTQLPFEEVYGLEMVMTVKLLTEGEMEEAVKASSF